MHEEERPPHYINQDGIQTVTISASYGDVWAAQFMYGVGMVGAYMMGSIAGVAAGMGTTAFCEVATTPINTPGCIVAGTVIGNSVGGIVTDWAKNIVEQ